MATAPRTPIPPPRNGDTYTQYVRRNADRFQARPWLNGERHYLGSFPTYDEAWGAVYEFFRGRRDARPKYVRGKPGQFYAHVPNPAGGFDRGPDRPTPEKAAADVRRFLRRRLTRAGVRQATRRP